VPTDEQRQRTLERFEQHRRAWQANAALRALYADWYASVAAALPAPELGPRLEVGSGPGFARDLVPGLILTDVVVAPWHDLELNAQAIPYPDGGVGALVLFDVLHHVSAPRQFFREAARVLRPGGRIVLCEPYISPLSYPIYKLLHEEPVDLSVDPLDPSAATGDPATASSEEKDPFDSNQAIPTLLFGRWRGVFEREFPSLAVKSVQRLAGPSYPASGGFSHTPLLPAPLLRALHALERRLPAALFRLIGFRLLAVLERR
jgi:SAM-dependent methyltransferase